MFTGLVQGLGKIVSRSGNELVIRPEFDLPNLQYGESIAVNGCCLTLEKSTGNVLTFHTMQESLRRTNLGSLSCNSLVNLESATHRQMNDEELKNAGVPADLVRLSCGLESYQDLIDDIAQALKTL